MFDLREKPSARPWILSAFTWLDFLRQQGTYKQAPRPDLILRDLNLRAMDVREPRKDISDLWKTKEQVGSLAVQPAEAARNSCRFWSRSGLVALVADGKVYGYRSKK
jgi:hypothetical protein